MGKKHFEKPQKTSQMGSETPTFPVLDTEIVTTSGYYKGLSATRPCIGLCLGTPPEPNPPPPIASP